MCLTIAYFTSWSYSDLMKMSVAELMDWYMEMVDMHGLNKKEPNTPRRGGR